MKKLNFTLLTVVLIAFSFASYSQDNTSTITVTKMGTLGATLNQTQKNAITKLILKGEINKADFEVMKNEMPNLTYIDLKDVKCEYNKIPKSAFGGKNHTLSNKNITTVILPNSLETIDAAAFAYCSGLTSINIPDNVTSIGVRAFAYCRYVTGPLVIPNKVTRIGHFAFASCKNITGEITIPTNVAIIEKGAFRNCDKVEAFIFPHNQVFPYRYSFEPTPMIPSGVRVKVPSGLVDAYKNHEDYWIGHKDNIEAI